MSVLGTLLLLSALCGLILIVFRLISYRQQLRVLESDLQAKLHTTTVQALRDENSQLVQGLQDVAATLSAALTNRPVWNLQQPQDTAVHAPVFAFEPDDESEDYVLADDGSNEVISYEEDNVLLGLIQQD